jgi:hypothetical protein
MLLFAIQVAERGYVYNYLDGKDFWEKIVNRDFGSHEDFAKFYEPIKEGLIEKLRSITNKYREFEARLRVEQPDAVEKEIPIISYIRAFGLDAVPRDLSIEITRHTKYNNLIHFRFHPEDSPFDTDISNDCKILILDESHDWQVVGFGFKRFFSYTTSASEVSGIDIKTVKFTEKLNGHHAVLYSYSNEWHVASRLTADGSDSFANGLTFSEVFWETWKAYVVTRCDFSSIVPSFLRC